MSSNNVSEANASVSRDVSDQNEVSETPTLDDSNTENEKAQILKGPIVPGKAVGSKLFPAGIALLVVFWINVAHLYGIFYRQGNHTKQGQVALVDFDGGAFGQSLLAAAASLNQTYGHPTYTIIDSTSTDPEAVEHSIHQGKYWAAIYALEGATRRFNSTIENGDPYDASQTYVYVTLEARYYTFYVSNFLQTALAVTGAAGAILRESLVSPIMSTISASALANKNVRNAILGSSSAVQLDIASDHFQFDNKALLNTVGTVFCILPQFFFLMALNGIAGGLSLYATKTGWHHVRWRFLLGSIWPLIISLSVTGWTFAFRGAGKMEASTFFAFWAVTWVFMMINFDVLDIATAFIPIGFLPLFVLTWIIFSVAATIGPPDIINHWYRISYFMPSLHWWQTVITVLTHGAVSRLVYTLPTLAGWFVIMKIFTTYANYYRAGKARATFSQVSQGELAPSQH